MKAACSSGAPQPGSGVLNVSSRIAAVVFAWQAQAVLLAEELLKDLAA